MRLGFIEGSLGKVVVIGAGLCDSLIALLERRLLWDFFRRWELRVVGISYLARLTRNIIRVRSGTLS